MYHGSAADKSLIQPIHGAWRNSTAALNTQYSEMNTGICTSIGRQPPSGLIFSFLYSAIISVLSLARSSA